MNSKKPFWTTVIRKSTPLQIVLSFFIPVVFFVGGIYCSQILKMADTASFAIGTMCAIAVFFLYNIICYAIGRKRDMFHPIDILDFIITW